MLQVFTVMSAPMHRKHQFDVGHTCVHLITCTVQQLSSFNSWRCNGWIHNIQCSHNHKIKETFSTSRDLTFPVLILQTYHQRVFGLPHVPQVQGKEK